MLLKAALVCKTNVFYMHLINKISTYVPWMGLFWWSRVW